MKLKPSQNRNHDLKFKTKLNVRNATQQIDYSGILDNAVFKDSQLLIKEINEEYIKKNIYNIQSVNDGIFSQKVNEFLIQKNENLTTDENSATHNKDEDEKSLNFSMSHTENSIRKK